MGWYDDEDASRLPEWAEAPMLWLLCLCGALMPTLLVLGLLQWLFPHAPAYLSFLVYGVLVALFIASVRPWIVR